ATPTPGPASSRIVEIPLLPLRWTKPIPAAFVTSENCTTDCPAVGAEAIRLTDRKQVRMKNGRIQIRPENVLQAAPGRRCLQRGRKKIECRRPPSFYGSAFCGPRTPVWISCFA